MHHPQVPALRDFLAGPRKICRVNLELQQTHILAVSVLPAGAKMLLRTMILGAQALLESQALGRGTGPASMAKELGKGAERSGPAGMAVARKGEKAAAAKTGVKYLPQGGSWPMSG
jgi:hypothetical protein